MAAHGAKHSLISSSNILKASEATLHGVSLAIWILKTPPDICRNVFMQSTRPDSSYMYQYTRHTCHRINVCSAGNPRLGPQGCPDRIEVLSFLSSHFNKLTWRSSARPISSIRCKAHSTAVRLPPRATSSRYQG